MFCIGGLRWDAVNIPLTAADLRVSCFTITSWAYPLKAYTHRQLKRFFIWKIRQKSRHDNYIQINGNIVNRRPSGWNGLLDLKIFVTGISYKLMRCFFQTLLPYHKYLCICAWCTLNRLSVMVNILGVIYFYHNVTLFMCCSLLSNKVSWN